MPNKFLHNPPIRHRGQDKNVGIGVFECAVLGAVLLLARSRVFGKGAYVEARHTSALQHGKEAIQRYRPKFKRGKKQSRRDFEAFLHSEYRDVGEDAYLEGQKEFTLIGPLDIIVTKAELLSAAGLGERQLHQTKNLRELDAALKRMITPIVAGLPPLLQSIKGADRKLRLTIDPLWLPGKKYGRVLWPPPKTGSVVLALYLFLAGCRLRAKTSIALLGLYHRIGVRDSRPSHARRSLERALQGANAHLSLAHDGMENIFPKRVTHTVFNTRQRVRFSGVYSTAGRRYIEVDAAAVHRVRSEKQAGREVGW